jgi:hypothetical protein
MEAFKDALGRLFGDSRVGDCEAAISEGAAQSFGWAGWSMPKWTYTVSGTTQATSDVVKLIGSYLNPPVSVVGAPTGRYYSARKYTYWVVLTLLAVALGYGLYKIVSRWRASPKIQASAAVPNENEFALPVMNSDNTTIDWPATLEKANGIYRAQVVVTGVETVVSYRVRMFAAYFVAADDGSERERVIEALMKHALNGSIVVPWKDSPSTLSACLNGAINDLSAGTPKGALLKHLIASWNVGDDWGANVTLNADGKVALDAFDALLASLDPSGRIGLLHAVAVETAFGRKNAKRRENRNASLAKRATQCQFLVPCGSNPAGKLCRCENTVSAYDDVPLCSAHAAKTSDMAAFRASMVVLRSTAGGVAEADRAINAAMNEIRGAAMWGKGQLDAKGTESEFKLTPGFADLPKFGGWIPGSRTLMNAAVSSYNFATGRGGAAAQLAPEIETSTALERTSSQYRSTGALPQTQVKAHARPAAAAQSPPEFETSMALVVSKQPPTSSISESLGSMVGESQERVTTGRSRRSGDAIGTGGDWAPVDLRKLRRNDPSVRIPRGMQSEQYLKEVRETAAKVFAAYVKEQRQEGGQALLTITNGTDAERRAAAAEAIDKEMSPRGSTGSVMRLLGHTTKGSRERNDTALTETELRKLATGLVTRRAHKTKINNFALLVIGLANIETVDRTIAGFDAASA